MTAIPNARRRGAIYWFRRSRRLPSGNRFRANVSLRTACPQAARFRAAVLTMKFEELFLRLFGSPQPKFTMADEAAKRVFQAEFNKALDNLENERELAVSPSYDFRNFDTFLDVHEEVYRFLADESCFKEDVTIDSWLDRVPHLDPEAAAMGFRAGLASG